MGKMDVRCRSEHNVKLDERGLANASADRTVVGGGGTYTAKGRDEGFGESCER